MVWVQTNVTVFVYRFAGTFVDKFQVRFTKLDKIYISQLVRRLQAVLRGGHDGVIVGARTYGCSWLGY